MPWALHEWDCECEAHKDDNAEEDVHLFEEDKQIKEGKQVDSKVSKREAEYPTMSNIPWMTPKEAFDMDMADSDSESRSKLWVQKDHVSEDDVRMGCKAKERVEQIEEAEQLAFTAVKSEVEQVAVQNFKDWVKAAHNRAKLAQKQAKPGKKVWKSGKPRLPCDRDRCQRTFGPTAYKHQRVHKCKPTDGSDSTPDSLECDRCEKSFSSFSARRVHICIPRDAFKSSYDDSESEDYL